MARGINKVILVGNLGRDPDVRYTSNGSAVANIAIATTEQWTDKQSGQKQEKTEWHRVVMFGRLGEIAGEYLKKGQQVYIEGRLQTREWEKDGVKRYTTEIVANEMQMLGGPRGGGGSADFNQGGSQRGDEGGFQGGSRTPSGGAAGQPAGGQAPSSGGNFDDFDDDIPF